MPPRRSHCKSRLGCLQSKGRKIKFDETPPPCGNCKKHDMECKFAVPPGPAATNGRLAASRPDILNDTLKLTSHIFIYSFISNFLYYC
ncbi:hypothetical protein PAAG_06598 [Paracoccidioides lutzii Pb01]|uniref:Zn(2)-C6 fungal-type domain-containing protein n=1 Tax=Paracoccidioides lutzii (strain ATCC MYA-826 / Pb01) TaxID=502779 RepID=C1H757_PARBA|nr:hypothetical protein PAAG_06598 [Paracoccidioides lutzii Pb01]EEH35551.2 hypothetical protein PAAG_06598 [Paracoccidioides lutzii Pb01]